MNKQKMLTANGSFDTLIDKAGQEYNGITLSEIAAIVREPQAREKADAAFMIPSTYRKHDGRNHAAQRERGEYWMLAIDVDTGSPSLTEITQAIRAAIGPAACLIYSSSSASMDERKWRALIPVAEPLTGEEYVDAQLALFDLMRDQGIACDPALSRAGQPIYLPNVPPARRDDTGQPEFYHCHLERGEGYLVVKESRVWAGVEFRRKQEQIAQAKAAQERERRQAERAAKRADRPNDVDPVAEFNDRHTIADLLHKYGYEQHGRSNSYRSPHQSSGSYATKDFGTHWVSLSQSDAAAGIGQVKAGDVTICWGDAFDLFCFYEHGGVMKTAVREYAKELRPADAAKTRDDIVKAATEHDDLSDFDFIPSDDIDLSAPIQQSASVIVPKPDRKPIFWARDAAPVLTSSYLIKGWLGAGQMSVVYGPSNVGKSFFALDMAFCVAANIEWQGCRVRGGTVLYLATEGGNAFHNRVVALRQEYGIPDAALAVRPSPVDLLRPEVDLAELIELCKEIEQERGSPVSLIVIDTLSRAMAGGDENGPTDMTAFIANVDALRDVTGAHNMIVHHSGKDTAKGARGHSSLRAATDTEIELDVAEGIRTANPTKQRDLEPQPPLVFALKVHKLGQDEDGDPVTTCTITPADADMIEDINQKKPKGANQIALASAFKQMRAEGIGQPNPSGTGWPEAGKYWAIDEGEFRKFAIGKLASANPRDAYLTAIKAMLATGFMVQNEGLIWMTGKGGRVSG